MKKIKGRFITSAFLALMFCAFILLPFVRANAYRRMEELQQSLTYGTKYKTAEELSAEAKKNGRTPMEQLEADAKEAEEEKKISQEEAMEKIRQMQQGKTGKTEEEVPQKDNLPSEEPDSGSKEKAKEALVEDVSGELQLSDEDKKRAAELVTKYLNGDSVELTEEDRAKLQVYMQGAKEKQVIEQLLADKTMLPPNTGDRGYTEVWNASVNPWDIISGRQGVASGIYSLGGDTFAQRLFRLLRTTLVVVCLIGTMCSLITIPFISSSAQLRERKEELTHKAIIFALSFAIIPILNFLRLLMDYQFGIR